VIVLIIIGIVFYNYAKSSNINQAVWVLIGLASYFVPQVIVGVVIALVAPHMVNERGMLTIIGIAVGLIGAVIAYQVMVNYAKKAKIKEVDDSLLDSEL